MVTTAVEIPEAPPEAQLYMESETNGTISWTEFTENTTFHGVKNIFQQTSITLRRPVWLVVVVASLLVFVIQVSVRVGDFFQYKTFVDVGVTYNNSLQFPAITICNQNTFRMTATVKHGLYDVIDGVFKVSNISKIPWESFNGKENGIDYEKFLNTTGHQKLQFIHSCVWNGDDCDIDSNFKAILTDLGLCYTFNTKDNEVGLQATEPGADAGLKLVINVEQYEYMRGPQNDAGVKILLHPVGEMPIMGEHGFAAAPGSHTLVAIKRSELETLMPPYGLCHPFNLPINQCHAQCRSKGIINSCGCRAVNMPSASDNITANCDLKSSLSCARKALAEMKRSKSACVCNPPCLQVKYKPRLSYAKLSKFNIDRITLDNPQKQEKLQERYIVARDTAHRHITEIKAGDDRFLPRIVVMGNDFLTVIQNNKDKIINPITAAQHFNLPPILNLKPIQSDLSQIAWHVSQAHKKVRNDFIGNYSAFLLYTGKVISEFEMGSTFNVLLQSCMDMVNEARLHTNGTDLTLEENVTLNYGSQECKEDIRSRVEDLETQRSSGEHHFDNLSDFQLSRTWYQRFLDGFFDNTDKTAGSIADHQSCLRFLDLGETLAPDFSELFNLTDTFIASLTVMEHKAMADKIQYIIQLGNIKNAIRNLRLCDWAGKILMKTKEDFQELTSFINVQVVETNAEALRAFTTLANAMATQHHSYNLWIIPLIKIISAYNDETIEKYNLSLLFNSPEVSKNIADMAASRTNAYTLIEHLQDKFNQYRFNLEQIYLFVAKSPFPLMTTNQIKNLQFFKEIAATIRGNYLELLDGISVNATLNIEQLFEEVFINYEEELSNVLTKSMSPQEKISHFLTLLQGQLAVFKESTVLNSNFFMENFLQVDIFYRDMSYEVISQQMAFGPLSLLGEIGGFMGLLLGASVITVCELLDYVFINIVRVCIHKHRIKTNRIEVSPASVSMKSIKT